MNNNNNLKHDLIRTAVFAIIMGLIVACGGKGALTNPIVQGSRDLVRLVTLPRSGHRIMPNTSGPVEASLMAAAPTPSQLAQSYDVQCTVSQAFSVPPGDLVPIPTDLSSGTLGCNQFLSQPVVAAAPSAKQTFFDGTLTSLVVTGKTVGGATFQCRDIQTQLAIADNSWTGAFLDLHAHTVHVFNQVAGGSSAAVDAGFTCNGIGTDTDPVATIEVQFAKI